MAHIEEGECARIGTSTLDDLREKKLEFPRILEALTKQPVKGNYANCFTPDPQYASGTHDDWAVLEAEPEIVVSNNDKVYPALATTSTHSRADKKEPIRKADEPMAWSVKKNLFPNATPAQKQTPEQLEAATASSVQDYEEDMDIDAPDHPKFNVGRYLCPYAGKFVCPKVRCG
jgi:hypothetical protein